MDTSKVVTLYAVVGAIVGLGSYAYAFGDVTGMRPWFKFEQDRFTQSDFQLVMDKTEQNTLANARQDFIYIEGKKDRGVELTWEEKRDFCTNAKILEYPVEGCSKDGDPIITFTSKAVK